MVCSICGKKGARVQRISKTVGRGKNLLVIENVPVVRCPHCGETYLEADTLHELERIKLHRKNLSKERLVPVAHYS
ncbi:MAG TPA: type II toxin-antitoxin system MqsA family antitoxin [bacterium]|nr:type II toxin-antitoxin system MqsA family antitoxin [bacterium]